MRFILVPLLVFCLFISFSQAQDWTKITSCGEYKVRGVARLIKKSLLIIVNEKTQSEVTIKVPINNEANLAPYLDKPLEATVIFAKNANGPEVSGKIKDVKSRLPDPLNPMDTGINLISKSACE